MRVNTLVILAITGSVAVAAEPDAVYEPLSDLELGRVFLTPDERELLDRQRAAAVDDGRVLQPVSEDAAVVAPRRKPAAGIILAEGGRPLVWVGGEFRRVDTASIEDIDFPAKPGIHIHANPRVERVSATAPEFAGAERAVEIPAAARVAGTESDDERNEN